MFVEECDIAILVFVIFVPLDARRHSEELLNRNIIVDGPFQVRDIVGNLIIYTLDKTVLDCGTNQGRRKGFGNREAGPSPLGIKAKAVFFQSNFTVLNNDQSCRSLFTHIVVDIHRDGNWITRWQRENRTCRRNDIGLGQQGHPVESAKCSIALWYRPKEHIPVCRQVGQNIAHVLFRAEVGES